MDEEEEKLMEEARQWLSFVMDDALHSKEKMKEKLQQLQQDLNGEFDVNEEKIVVYNFVSYLQWRLGDREKAFAASKLAEGIEIKPNLITHCKKVIFLMELEQPCRSRKL